MSNHYKTSVNIYSHASHSALAYYAKNLALTFSIALCFGVGARLSYKLHNIPITMQTLVMYVLMALCVQSSANSSLYTRPVTRKFSGHLAQKVLLGYIAYLFMGSSSLGMFFWGGGALYLFTSPTAGYLWGMALSLYCYQLLTQRFKKQASATFVTICLAFAAMFTLGIGALFLSVITQTTFSAAWGIGGAPFVYVECLKIACAYAVMFMWGGAKRLKTFYSGKSSQKQ